MTSVEFRATLALAELSQLEAARMLGVAPRTVRRWALGEADIPPPVAKLLYLLGRGLVGKEQLRHAPG